MTDKLSIPDHPMKIIEFFAGSGVPRIALNNLGITHTSIISEIDKHAIAAYNAIHGVTPNLGDIQNIRTIPECDILTAGFPCQSLSIAGKKDGMKRDSGTESSLGWDIVRILEDSDKPKNIIIENSDQFFSKRNRRDADQFLSAFSRMGYTISKKIMNAKHYGSPQNRPRAYIIMNIEGNHFNFPQTVPLNICLKDKLQDNVPSSYYLTADQMRNYQAHKERHEERGNGFGWDPLAEKDTALSLSLSLRIQEDRPERSLSRGGNLE